jgi:DNA primase
MGMVHSLHTKRFAAMADETTPSGATPEGETSEQRDIETRTNEVQPGARPSVTPRPASPQPHQKPQPAPARRAAEEASSPPEPEPETLEEAKEALARKEKRIANLTAEKDRHKRKADELGEFAEQKRREEEAQVGEQEKTRRKIAKLEEDHRTKESEITALRSELANTLIDHEIEREAIRQEFRNAEHAPRLVDRDRIEIDPESRKVSGVKAAVEKFLKDYPEYASGNARGGTGPVRNTPNGGVPRPGVPRPNNDPHYQELQAMGKGGRM